MKFVINTVIAAVIIATFAELGKRSSFAGALLVALPLTSILALSFLYFETKDVEKVSSLSYGIFWLVLPTLLFFLILPMLLKTGIGFWASIAVSCVSMTGIFFGYAWALRKFGVTI
jgi:predicted permease